MYRLAAGKPPELHHMRHSNLAVLELEEQIQAELVVAVGEIGTADLVVVLPLISSLFRAAQAQEAAARRG